jgi:hypothetical protein
LNVHLKRLTIRSHTSDRFRAIYSAFYTRSDSIYLEARGKAQLIVHYLPLQFMKHAAVVVFTNDRVGDFLYHLEGMPTTPAPIRCAVDESSLDHARIKLVNSARKLVLQGDTSNIIITTRA